MSTLRVAAQEYLVMRRALGFKLTVFAPRLMSFVAFCEDKGVEHVNTDLAVEWATTTPRASADHVYQARRLDVVRLFARHMAVLDAANQVPGLDVLPHRYRRAVPYHYPPEQITALMDAAATLTPKVRAATWRTLIGLLATTGMRDGEACRLRRHDVDLDEGVLQIIDSKFGKSRQIYLHPSTATALGEYVQIRDQAFAGATAADTFFVNSHGKPLDVGNLRYTFIRLLEATGLRGVRDGVRDPRLHDLRHSFTIATMLDWYRDGSDVQARLPLLATWLGHVDPKSTYWYLQAVPELLALAAGRLEAPDQPTVPGSQSATS